MAGKEGEDSTKKEIQEIVQEGKWLLFVGGTATQREQHARNIVSKRSKTIDDCQDPYIIDLAGQSGPEIVDLVLGKNFASNLDNNIKRLKSIAPEYLAVSEDMVWDRNRTPQVTESMNSTAWQDVKLARKIQGYVGESPILNLLIPYRTLFINNLQCESKEDINALKKIAAFLRQNINDFKSGLLMVGVESNKDYKKLPADFQQLFEVVNLKSGKTKKVNSLNSYTGRKSYKDNEDYMKVLTDTLQTKLDTLKGETKESYDRHHYSINKTAEKVIIEMENKGTFYKHKKDKTTGKMEKRLIYEFYAIRKHIQKDPLWEKITKKKDNLSE